VFIEVKESCGFVAIVTHLDFSQDFDNFNESYPVITLYSICVFEYPANISQLFEEFKLS